MALEPLGLFARLWLAFVVEFKVVFDGVFAAEVARLMNGEGDLLPEKPPEKPSEPAPEEPLEPEPELGTDPTSALQLLGILQREGRFMDFLQEDVAGASDEDIGAAARVVQAGCKRGLAEYLEVQAVRSENEGDTVVLEAGFDATRTRLTGRVAGEPPYSGQLAHHGWEVREIRLPEVTEGHDPRVVAPAEVELS